MTSPLAPQPMSPSEIADLVERVRKADAAVASRGFASGGFAKGNQFWKLRGRA